jgi:hypothetical protein
MIRDRNVVKRRIKGLREGQRAVFLSLRCSVVMSRAMKHSGADEMI